MQKYNFRRDLEMGEELAYSYRGLDETIKPIKYTVGEVKVTAKPS